MQQKHSKTCPSYNSAVHLECFLCGLHFLLTGIAFRLSFVRLVQPSAVGTPPAIFVIGCAEILFQCRNCVVRLFSNAIWSGDTWLRYVLVQPVRPWQWLADTNIVRERERVQSHFVFLQDCLKFGNVRKIWFDIETAIFINCNWADTRW
jgi:hypothetical protein